MSSPAPVKRHLPRAFAYRIGRILLAFFIIALGGLFTGGIIGYSCLIRSDPNWFWFCEGADYGAMFGVIFGFVFCLPVSYLRLLRYTVIATIGTLSFPLPFAFWGGYDGFPVAMFMGLSGFSISNACALALCAPIRHEVTATKAQTHE